jgi:hypothetical protein
MAGIVMGWISIGTTTALVAVFALLASSKGPTSSDNLSAATPSSTSTPLDSRLSWRNANFDVLNSVRTDAVNVLVDMATPTTSEKLDQLGLDCSALGSDASTALDAPPIPDSTAESDWSTALKDLQLASTECPDAIAYFQVWGLDNNQWNDLGERLLSDAGLLSNVDNRLVGLPPV